MHAARLALAVALASLALLPFVPILPGLGSMASVLLGVLSYGQENNRRRWIAVVAMVIGGLGTMLALIQLLAALLYPLTNLM